VSGPRSLDRPPQEAGAEGGSPLPVDLSVVVPVHNEEDCIDEFLSRTEAALRTIPVTYEILFVNDGSRDRTLEIILGHRRRNPLIKAIDLSRNFGKEYALSAGLRYSSGRAVIPVDVDLQDPPELIPQLYAKWREGFDTVYAMRTGRRGEGLLKRLTAFLYYRIHNTVATVPIPPNTGDFRLIDRSVVDAINRLPEHNRFMKGLFAWVGYRSTGIPYERKVRYAGYTKWNFWRLWTFALDGITSFTTLPLRVASYVGLLVSLLAFAYGAFEITYTLIHGIDLPGYASLLTVMLFLGGIQLIALGIIGEYMARLFTEVKGRPRYIVRATHGVGPAPSEWK